MLISELYKLYLEFPKVCIDTRTIIPGSFFFCIKGDTFDGNEFAYQAIELGASYVVSDDKNNIHPQIIIVDSVLDTLQLLAAHHRSQFTFPVIGITGSNGKTTNKELISHLLMSRYKVAYTKGNFNNHIGVPLTLLSVNLNDQIAVIEMGANHPGEIAELSRIVKPDIGLITNIGRAHLEGFGGFEGVVNTKKALYDSVRDQNGIVFVNGDDDLLMELSKDMVRFVFGTKEGSLQGEICQKETFLSVQIINSDLILDTQLVGTYNLPNVLAAVSIAKYFNLDDTTIKESLFSYQPTNNRSQLIKTEHNEIIMDSYNANPSSMGVAIDHFFSLSKPNKVAIIGEMRELGEYSKSEHAIIVSLFKEAPDVIVYYVGEEFVNLFDMPNESVFHNSQEAISYFETHPLKNAYILVKGSRGMKLETLLPYL